MSKVALKNKLRKEQKGFCSVSAKQLAEETRLFDTDRIEPKAKGEYTRMKIPVHWILLNI